MSDNNSDDEAEPPSPPPPSNPQSAPLQNRHFQTLEQNQANILNVLRTIENAQNAPPTTPPHILFSIECIELHLRDPAAVAIGTNHGFRVSVFPHEPHPGANCAALANYWADRFRKVGLEVGGVWLDSIAAGLERVRRESEVQQVIPGNGGGAGETGRSGGDQNCSPADRRGQNADKGTEEERRKKRLEEDRLGRKREKRRRVRRLQDEQQSLDERIVVEEEPSVAEQLASQLNQSIDQPDANQEVPMTGNGHEPSPAPVKQPAKTTKRDTSSQTASRARPEDNEDSASSAKPDNDIAGSSYESDSDSDSNQPNKSRAAASKLKKKPSAKVPKPPANQTPQTTAQTPAPARTPASAGPMGPSPLPGPARGSMLAQAVKGTKQQPTPATKPADAVAPAPPQTMPPPPTGPTPRRGSVKAQPPAAAAAAADAKKKEYQEALAAANSKAAKRTLGPAGAAESKVLKAEKRLKEDEEKAARKKTELAKAGKTKAAGKEEVEAVLRRIAQEHDAVQPGWNQGQSVPSGSALDSISEQRSRGGYSALSAKTPRRRHKVRRFMGRDEAFSQRTQKYHGRGVSSSDTKTGEGRPCGGVWCRCDENYPNSREYDADWWLCFGR
jgi:hypothetical protein